MTKPTVFISYSHKDDAWKDRLRPHLRVLEQAGRITIWGARLHLACGEKEKARKSLAKAKEMIDEMGYHRRDGEVAELEVELESLKH
jgi:hypothetical protein